MSIVADRRQWIIGGVLVMLMAITRGYHFADFTHLPGASWAVFFLAGFYVRPGWVFWLLLAEAGLLDYAAVTWGGVSSFCISPAYGFLLPAYLSLWLGGRWYARRYRFEWRTLMPLAAAILASAMACELFSSGGFYFFSGRFTETPLEGFGTQLLRYSPAYLQSLLFYLGLAVGIHGLFALARDPFRPRRVKAG